MVLAVVFVLVLIISGLIIIAIGRVSGGVLEITGAPARIFGAIQIGGAALGIALFVILAAVHEDLGLTSYEFQDIIPYIFAVPAVLGLIGAFMYGAKMTDKAMASQQPPPK